MNWYYFIGFKNVAKIEGAIRIADIQITEHSTIFTESYFKRISLIIKALPLS